MVTVINVLCKPDLAFKSINVYFVSRRDKYKGNNVTVSIYLGNVLNLLMTSAILMYHETYRAGRRCDIRSICSVCLFW